MLILNRIEVGRNQLSQMIFHFFSILSLQLQDKYTYQDRYYLLYTTSIFLSRYFVPEKQKTMSINTNLLQKISTNYFIEIPNLGLRELLEKLSIVVDLFLKTFWQIFIDLIAWKCHWISQMILVNRFLFEKLMS